MRVIALITFVLSVLLAGTTSASAADPRLGLSRDGVSWDMALTPLFDSGIRWVPGDTRSASFFVRNQSTDPAELSVDVLDTRIDELLRTGDLTISARAEGTVWRDVTTPGRHRLITWVPQDPQQSTRVDVRVAFDPTSTNESQTLSLDLDLQVLLRQGLAPIVGDGGVDAPGALPGTPAGNVGANDGVLPNTGAPAFWSVFAGMAFVISGLIVALKRRQEEESHVQ